MDDEDRENEGDFIIAAEKVTPRENKFYANSWSRCALCSYYGGTLQGIGIDKQVNVNTSIFKTPFTITIDKIEGCSTGVSALPIIAATILP